MKHLLSEVSSKRAIGNEATRVHGVGRVAEVARPGLKGAVPSK